jgi:ABC-type nickel/cobalt efflux system permease component RcnA
MRKLKTQTEVLVALGELKGLNPPKSHNTFIKVDHDYSCGCGREHNTKDSDLNYLAVALPVRHLFQCAHGYITCIKQGMFSCKAEFTYHKDLTKK